MVTMPRKNIVRRTEIATERPAKPTVMIERKEKLFAKIAYSLLIFNEQIAIA